LISDYGGLAKTMPIYATMLVIFSLSSLGLPGTNSFVGEFLVLLGAFITYPAFAVVASFGIILAAVYMLWMVQRVAFGEANPKNARHPDLNLRELATVVPLVVAVFWIGVYPAPLLDVLHVSVDHLLEQTKLTDRAVAGLGWSELWGLVQAAFTS
ncbi:MAG: proton-conducting transporter membrane subunit, partial [Candidatus Manganitrophaceae bacterium]